MCIRDRYKDKGGAMRFECVASFPLMIHRAQQEQTYAAHVIRIVLDVYKRQVEEWLKETIKVWKFFLCYVIINIFYLVASLVNSRKSSKEKCSLS